MQWAVAYANAAQGKSVSIEVLDDEFFQMGKQAMKLSRIQPNVFVKIPITNTLGHSSLPLVCDLAKSGIPVNLTAMTCYDHINAARLTPHEDVPIIFSIFCGRINDTGSVPPVPVHSKYHDIRFLWASTREVFNITQAAELGYDVITVSPEIFQKYHAMNGRDLEQVSLDTVRQFADDSKAANYTL
jgi:transaldolase